MSTTQAVIGLSFAAIVTQAALSLVLPEVPPIDVHSLKYQDGVILQDRTVTADGDYFPAEWRAAIISKRTGLEVPSCSGRGFWNYPAGRIVAPIPLEKWVGSDTCTPAYLRWIGGEFYPVASWHYGNNAVIAKGDYFKP